MFMPPADHHEEENVDETDRCFCFSGVRAGVKKVGITYIYDQDLKHGNSGEYKAKKEKKRKEKMSPIRTHPILV